MYIIIIIIIALFSGVHELTALYIFKLSEREKKKSKKSRVTYVPESNTYKTTNNVYIQEKIMYM